MEVGNAGSAGDLMHDPRKSPPHTPRSRNLAEMYEYLLTARLNQPANLAHTLTAVRSPGSRQANNCEFLSYTFPKCLAAHSSPGLISLITLSYRGAAILGLLAHVRERIRLDDNVKPRSGAFEQILNVLSRVRLGVKLDLSDPLNQLCN